MNQAHQRSAGAGKAGGNARTSLQQHCLLKRSCCVVRRALCPSAGASFARLGWSRAWSLPCERRTSCFAPQSASARAACRCLSCAPLRTCASACAAPGGSAHQRPGCAMVTDAAYQHRLSSRHSRAASGAPEWHTAASAHARRRQDSDSAAAAAGHSSTHGALAARCCSSCLAATRPPWAFWRVSPRHGTPWRRRVAARGGRRLPRPGRRRPHGRRTSRRRRTARAADGGRDQVRHSPPPSTLHCPPLRENAPRVASPVPRRDARRPRLRSWPAKVAATAPRPGAPCSATRITRRAPRTHARAGTFMRCGTGARALPVRRGRALFAVARDNESLRHFPRAGLARRPPLARGRYFRERVAQWGAECAVSVWVGA